MEPEGGPAPDAGWALPDSPADPAFARGSGALPGSRADRPAAAAAGPSSPVGPRLPVPMGPMTLPDVLDGSLRIIKTRPRTVFAIAAVILIPTHLLVAFLERNGSSTGISAVALVISTAASFFLGGALARLLVAWYADSDITAGVALRASFSRTLALLGAFVILLPVKALGWAFCGVPGVLAVVLFSLTAPAIVIEGLGPIAGARRSWRLVSRRFWMVVATTVVAAVGVLLLSSAWSAIIRALSSLAPGPLQWVLAGAMGGAVSLVLTTALLSVSVLLYLDLRIRTEGLDLELGIADAFAHAR